MPEQAGLGRNTRRHRQFVSAGLDLSGAPRILIGDQRRRPRPLAEASLLIIGSNLIDRLHHSPFSRISAPKMWMRVFFAV